MGRSSGTENVIRALEGERDAEGAPSSALAAMLPWRFLGMGLLIAWLCCTHLPDMFVNLTGDARAAEMANSFMRYGDIGTFLVAAVLSGKLGPLSRRPRACCAAIVASGVLSAALPYLAAALGACLAFAAACALAAVGGAVLFLLWAEVYSQLGPSRCVLYGAAGCVLAGVVSLAIARMDALAANVCIGLLPLGSGLAAAMSLARLPGERAWRPAPASDRAGEASRVRYPVPWKIIALMAFAGLASGFAGPILLDATHVGATHRIVSTAVIGLALLALFVARRGEFDVRVLAWVSLPLAVVTFAAIPFLPAQAGEAVSFLVKFSYVAFTLFALLMLANVAWRHEVPSLRLFAFGRASSEAAILAGMQLRAALKGSGLDAQTLLWVVALVGLLGVVGCVLLWHSERSVTSDWGATGVDPASGLHVPSRRELVLGRCEALAAEHGLTPRESEILGMLAQGLEPAQVESQLVLSHNTLKTHLRHLYAKLGVHTRDELMDMTGGRVQ